MQGKFISIEGLEGAGKSTALAFIAQYFQDKSFPVLLTREPGGTIWGEIIRQVLLKPDVPEVLVPEAELLLVFACRVQHIQQCILPALSKGQWIVSDRFIDASYAYQGGGRGIQQQYIDLLAHWLVKACHPDLTLLLDLSPEESLERTQHREQWPDRIEQEKIIFFKQVRSVYLKRAQKYPDRIKMVNATLSENSVCEAIQRILDEWIHHINTT